MADDLIFWILAVNGVFWGWRIFRTDNMVRAAYFLMISFIATGLVLLQLEADFMGTITILMMVGEMVIMALYMVIFMQNPGGLRPMTMVHQLPAARIAGWVSFLVLSGVAVTVDWPVRSQAVPDDDIAQIGQGMMGPKMLVFITAGVALFTTMIASVAMVLKRGRYDRLGDDLGRDRPVDPPVEVPEEMTG
jgi:NADH-quinone oxidoreductase subunit J